MPDAGRMTLRVGHRTPPWGDLNLVDECDGVRVKVYSRDYGDLETERVGNIIVDAVNAAGGVEGSKVAADIVSTRPSA